MFSFSCYIIFNVSVIHNSLSMFFLQEHDKTCTESSHDSPVVADVLSCCLELILTNKALQSTMEQPVNPLPQFGTGSLLEKQNIVTSHKNYNFRFPLKRQIFKTMCSRGV